jgi:hypothetical protein
VFENGVQRRIFVSRKEVTGRFGKCYRELPYVGPLFAFCCVKVSLSLMFSFSDFSAYMKRLPGIRN